MADTKLILDLESAFIFTEGILLDPSGEEIIHPNYQRKTIKISVAYGFHGSIVWEDLAGAIINKFQMRLVNKILMESDPLAQLVEGKNTISVRIDVKGKKEGINAD